MQSPTTARATLHSLLLLLLIVSTESRFGAQPSAVGTVDLTSGWATFGEAVAQGVASSGLQVGSLSTQTDVKNRWPDGSIRFAIVTVHAPAAARYAISAATVSPGTFTPIMPTAAVVLTMAGVPYTATLPHTAAPDRWLSGPLVSEGRTTVAPISGTDGSAHAFLRVNFDTRVYNDGTARVDVSVENMLDLTGASTVSYDVAIVVNRQEVFRQRGVEHAYLTRWRKVFATGSTPFAAVTPDLAPFTAARALPAYLPLVTNRVSIASGARYGILREGALPANMTDPRGPEAAPLPDWTARYLVHRDARQRAFVLANGDLSGSWPVHAREADDSATDGVGAERLLSVDERPTLWYDARAQAEGFDSLKGSPLPPTGAGTATQGGGQPLIPDNAHQPSLAFVPYLLSGDRYYAEEMAFWANYSVLRTDTRDGIRGDQGILESNEVRGIAWALRNLAEAAAFSPDASPVKAYLSQMVRNNLEWLDAYATSQDASTNPHSILWTGLRPEGPQYIALWEQNALAYAIDRANKLGFAGGTAHRDAIARLQLALFTNDPDYPRAQAAPALVAVGTADGGDATFFQTLSEIWRGSAAHARPLSGEYAAAARLGLMIGVENGWDGARGAYDYLWPFSVRDLSERAGWALDFSSPDAAKSTLAASDTAGVSAESDAMGAPTASHSMTHGTVAAPAGGALAAALGDPLPHNIPDFGTDASRTTVRSVQSGNWSSASSWSSGQVPTTNQVVHVDPGHVVTIDTTAAVAYTIAVHGTLRFNPSLNTRLRVTNLMVMGDHGMPSMTTVGTLEVGTAAAPIAASVTAEILIANTATGGGVADPEQFGTGLLNFGKLTMHGTPRTPTWTRVSVEPRSGQTTLTLSEAVTGWRAGDRLVLPDTRPIDWNETNGWVNLQNQWEELTIQSIAADNRTITLSGALQFNHLGARDFNNVLEFLPHVGNVTRNVIVRSESATGTRGHMISVHIADTDIRYALFRDLGRTRHTPLNTTTNMIGRYPIHMHHNRGPLPSPANGYQFTLIGNAVDGGSVATQFKWGIAIHNSHYGLIKDNVVYNYNGSAIATEDGSESFNMFDHNFVMRGMGEPDNAVDLARAAMGTEGVGFWFRGPHNYVRNNVAANYQNPTVEASYGFVYQFRLLGNVSMPTFKGADPAVAGQFTTRNVHSLPLLQFENNEAYGAMQGAFTYWWVGGEDPQPAAAAQESIVKDFKAWHTYNKTVYVYPGSKVTFDGLKIRGAYTSNSHCCGNGVHFNDYSQTAIVIRNSDIQGVNSGIDAPASGFGPGPNLLVENSILRNFSNIGVPTPSSVNGCWMSNKLVVVRNTQLLAPPGRNLSAISMGGPVSGAIECLSKLDEVRVYAYQGNANDNFQIYHNNGSVQPRPPGSCTPTTRPGIGGVTCPIAPLGPVPPTATMSASPASIPAGQSATLTWSTTNATTVSLNQGIGAVALSGTRSVSPAATTIYTLTATNATGSTTTTATVTVTALDTTPPVLSAIASSGLTTTGATITFTTNEQAYHQVEYGPTTAYGTITALDAMLMTSHSTVLTGLSPGTLYHYRARATDAAGNGGMSVDFTFTTAAVPLPAATLTAAPTSITSGAASTLTWSTSGATTVSINQGIGTVTASGTRSVSPAATTTYTLTATGAGGSVTATATVTVTTAVSPHNAARANSYDDLWQTGATGWVENAKAILAGGNQVPGMVLWIGDSLTRSTAMGAWAQSGAGKTAADITTTNWMHAGQSPQSVNSIDGFALATPYFCSARSYTVGDGLGSWHFMGTGMPTDLNQATAQQKLNDCNTYPGMLNLRTMLAALPKAQFAIPEVNLEASNPGVFTEFEQMVDYMISQKIVPIIITYTYRENNATFNGLVDQYNAGLRQYAQSKKLPLIDFNEEMLARLPLSQWPGRFLGDGTHYTSGSGTYPATSDPYANGGDPATHATGLALTYNGYGLKGWLGVQKMKEIKQLVIDGAPSAPTATMSASPATITAGAASTLAWATSGAATVSINQGIGTVASSGTQGVSPAATTTYTLTATNTTGSATASATVTVAALDTTPPVIGAVASADLTPSGATISFTTNEPAYHQVEYGPTTAYGTMTALDTMLMTSHSTVLSGLSPGLLYHYRARARDAAGNTGMSADLTFTTTSPGAQSSISVNFVGAAGASMGAAESAGVVAKANWNNATGATRSTPLALNNDSGTATGTTATWSSDNVWQTPITDQAGNRRLMKGYLDNGLGGATTITVAGLPAGSYDVYVYVDGDNAAGTRTGGYAISGPGLTTTTINLTDAANTNFNATFIQANNSAGNFVKFSVAASSGFTLTATPGVTSDANRRAPVSGVQIVSMAAAPSTPVITWPAPAAITYGTALGVTQLNATANVAGTFAYTPVSGTVLAAGAGQVLSVTFTPADAVTYSTATASVAITVSKATPLITWPTPAGIVHGTALSGTQLNATATVPGAFVYTPAGGTVLGAGAGQTLSVAFTPTDAVNYSTAAATVAITVSKATPVITWAPPASIVYGTALSGTQLNATATVPGTFAYMPPGGTVLAAGAGQTLSVSFTPASTANYNTATRTVAITVSKATPALTWPTPAAIASGTPLGATQLNATASVPGTFVYTPPSGTVLAAGPQALSVAFTPADAANYTTAAASVTINVSPPQSTQSSIGLNFVGGGVSMAATESAGVVAKVNWNNATGATRSTPLALQNDSGAVTGTTATWSSDNVWQTPIADQAGNRRMMKGYLDTGFERATTVTVAGLPAGTYDVYVYVDGDNGSGTRTGGYRISGAGITTTTINLTDGANTNFNTTFTQANNSTGNFVKFSIAASSGFTLTATPGASDGSRRAPVSGVQIVPR